MVSLCSFAMLEFAHAAYKFKIRSFHSMIFVYSLNHKFMVCYAYTVIHSNHLIL
jgi:hypothetical protein